MLLCIIFGLTSIAAALGVILNRRPIYSALFLLVNFASLAVFYVMLQAQFLAAVEVIVYAGAIVVVFLFVVMLVGGGEIADLPLRGALLRSSGAWARIAGVVLAMLLAGILIYGLAAGQLSAGEGSAQAFGQGSVEAIGQTLYTQYLLPFEMTSVLLLVGMVGAVVLARRD
jgi:NADH-quinone oxidoreductase subunit J